MDAFWSINNTLTSPSDIDAGELSSSFYRTDIDSLFLLGDATSTPKNSMTMSPCTSGDIILKTYSLVGLHWWLALDW